MLNKINARLDALEGKSNGRPSDAEIRAFERDHPGKPSVRRRKRAMTRMIKQIALAHEIEDPDPEIVASALAARLHTDVDRLTQLIDFFEAVIAASPNVKHRQQPWGACMKLEEHARGLKAMLEGSTVPRGEARSAP